MIQTYTWDTIYTLDLEGLTRIELLNILEWNDSNGVWSDADSIAEGFDIMSYADALAKVREVILESQE